MNQRGILVLRLLADECCRVRRNPIPTIEAGGMWRDIDPALLHGKDKPGIRNGRAGAVWPCLYKIRHRIALSIAMSLFEHCQV